MVLIGAKRFKIEKCPKGCHPAVYVEPMVYIGNEEFHRIAKDLKKSYIDLVERRLWRWCRTFFSQEDATQFAMDLARSLGEADFLDENSRLCLVMPSRVDERELGMG